MGFSEAVRVGSELYHRRQPRTCHAAVLPSFLSRLVVCSLTTTCSTRTRPSRFTDVQVFTYTLSILFNLGIVQIRLESKSESFGEERVRQGSRRVGLGWEEGKRSGREGE